MQREILLDYRDRRPGSDLRRASSWRGISVEYVVLTGERKFDYKWAGDRHYLALHDIKRHDGETQVDTVKPAHRLDIRGRMTYVPKGCQVSGWSHLAPRANSFVALYYDPELVLEEVQAERLPHDDKPMLYFDDVNVRGTLIKIQALLAAPTPLPLVYAETLGLLAVMEVDRLQQSGATPVAPEPGRLTFAQERLVREYISEHIRDDISLSDLSALVQLSRFHFARAFKATFSLPPHQFVLHQRVELAKTRLLSGLTSVQEVADSLGFTSLAQFSATFRKVTGISPTAFRRTRE